MTLRQTGNLILLFLVLFVGLGPFLSQQDPDLQNLSLRLLPPSTDFWLGTDEMGRDLFSRLAYGGRVSFGLGFGSLVFAGVTGSLVGFCAGFLKGMAGQLFLGFIEFLQAFPGILLGMIATAFFEPNLLVLVLAVGLSYFAGFARMARAKMMQVLKSGLYEAPVVLGASSARVVGVHLGPACFGALLAYAETNIASVLLVTSSFGFLGYGGVHLRHEWGTMLGEGRHLLRSQPLLQIYPGVLIFLTVLGFNLRRAR